MSTVVTGQKTARYWGGEPEWTLGSVRDQGARLSLHICEMG